MSTAKNNQKGILFILMGMAFFSIQDAMIKFVYEDCALYELYFGRTLIALMLLLIFMYFKKEEYKERLKKVQKSMSDKGIELLISHDTNNLNYLTGYDAWSFYYAQCAIIHVNAEEPLCFIRAQDAGGASVSYTHLRAHET